MSFAFYRKYRPNRFEDLVGQTPIQITLLEALKQNKLVHAYLFCGPRGTGKTSSARLIAKAIQCENRQESGEPCCECEMCKLNEKGELIDLIEIDAASNRGIDEIRDLREKINFSPTRAKYKVYIIDEVHMLTKEAFNALLKSLEEPPNHVYFVLATTEVHKIPETILSRCQRYDFRRIAAKDIVERLKLIAKKENLEVEIGALELLAKYADGGLRDAISLLEQFSTEPLTVDLVNERLGLTSHQSCDELYGALGSADTQKGLAVIENLHRDGYDLQQFTTAFLGLLRNKLHAALEGEKRAVVPKLLKWIELFDEAWMKLKRASISQLPLEIAVIRATHSMEQTSAIDQKQERSTPNTVRQKTNVPDLKQEGSNKTNISSKTLEPREDSTQKDLPVQEKRSEGLVHFDAIKKQLPKVLDQIKHPAVKLSFKTGNLKNLDGKTIKFIFSSKFHYDKVHSADAVVEIEEAFKKLMGADIKVICELDEGKMAPEVKDSPVPSNTPKKEIDTLGWETATENI